MVTWEISLNVSRERTRLRSRPFGFFKKGMRERSKSATRSAENFWMITSWSCSEASIACRFAHRVQLLRTFRRCDWLNCGSLQTKSIHGGASPTSLGVSDLNIITTAGSDINQRMPKRFIHK
jgi:hypothetical protein